jgi:signal transduction histidine kinase
LEPRPKPSTEEAAVADRKSLAAELAMTHSQLTLYARDLHQLVEVERRQSRELAEAHERLKQLDRLKTDFLTFVSHELRTLLTPLSVLQFIEPGADRREQEEVITIVRGGYQRLEKLVDTAVRYFERLAVKKQVTTTADLVGVVRAAVAGLPAAAAHRPADWLSVGLPASPCRVRGDADDLVRVVAILLDNAVKFAEDRPNVRVVVTAAAGEGKLVVTDRGRGFRPEQAADLFRPFTILDILHHSTGTGLSLALAAAIVESCGGGIAARSAGPGTGAEFTVTLPRAADVGN